MLIKIAEMIIKINCRYEYLPWLCQKYIIEEGEPLFEINVTQEEIETDHRLILEELGYDHDPGYLESLEAYRKICIKALEYGAMFLHSACIAVDGEAYCFTADSGTGKSTHIRLWKKLFGDRAVIVNGDKPLIRKFGGRYYVYGTPWCGKEGWSENMGAPIKALCLVERSPDNRIAPMDGFNVIYTIIEQTIRPRTQDQLDAVLDIMDGLLSSVPMYRLGCNMEDEAAVVAYEGMSGRKLKNDE